jgi:hypothetical protein
LSFSRTKEEKLRSLRGRHRAWGMEHRVRSQESGVRIQEKNIKERALFSTGYSLLTTDYLDFRHFF